MNIQARLADLMSKKKMTLRDVEKKSLVPLKSVASILNGASKNPTGKTLKAIAQALDISLEQMLSEDLSHLELLSDQELTLYKKCCEAFITVVIDKQSKLHLDKVSTLIKEIYDYSLGLYNQSDEYQIDSNFIDWVLKKNKSS
jgi:transcriptional regulator with XRE-family HTH domain